MADFMKEFYLYLMERKKFWLIPILFTLIAIGMLIFVAHGTALAPFIYTVF